jgi:RNA polymerase primary sigma factor
MELGRMPTPQELSERANIPLGKMEDLLKIKRDSISLSAPITGSDDATLGDFIPSESNNEYDEILNNMASENLIEIMLEALNQVEFEVLLYRFGLNNCSVRTLESIAKDRNLSRERIRQIEFRAIRKLQNPKYKRKLKGLLDGH